MSFHIVFCNNEHKIIARMILRTITPTAVATNSINQTANAVCQLAHRRLRETAEQPKETLEKTKKTNITIKAAKKEIIFLIILLSALAFTLWLLIQSCISLFA